MPSIIILAENDAVLVPSDVTDPVVTITGPTSAATHSTSATPLLVSGTATDNVGVFAVSWANSLTGGSGNAALVGGGTTSATWSASVPLATGDNPITVTCLDAAGNDHTDLLTVTLSVVADVTPPVCTITAPTSNPTHSVIVSPLNISGTATDNVAVASVAWANNRGGSGAAVVVGAGTTSATWSVTGIVLQTGDNILTVTASDTASPANTHADILTVTYTPDTVAPVCTITGPTSASTHATAAAALTLSGTASDNVAVTAVTVTNDRVPGPLTATGTTSWSAALTLEPGINILTATARDAANNTHADVLTVTYTPAPVLPLTETWNVPNAPGTMSGVHPWIQHVGTGGWGVVNNALQLANTGGVNAGRLSLDLLTNDYINTITIEEFFIVGGDICVVGPCARMQGNNSFTFYAAALVAVTGSTTLSIQKFVGGVQTSVGASVFITPHPNMTVGLWAEGNRFRALFDGAVVRDVLDTVNPILTGRFLGLEGWTDTGNRVRVTTLTGVGVVIDTDLSTSFPLVTNRPPVTARPLVTAWPLVP